MGSIGMVTPRCRGTGLAAAIARGEGELDALRSTLLSVEAALNTERARASKIKKQACKEPLKNQEARAQTLLEKLERERGQRRELRGQLAEASHQLDLSANEIAHLAQALANAEAARKESQKERIEWETAVRASRQRCIALDLELASCKEALAIAQVEAVSSGSSVTRLREQLAASRQHAAAQTAALALATAARQRLQTHVAQLESKQMSFSDSRKEEVDDLRRELREARAEIGSLRAAAKVQEARLNTTTWAAARATGDCRLNSIERRALCERLHESQIESVRQAAAVSDLKGKLESMHVECRHARQDAAAARMEQEAESRAQRARVAASEAEKRATERALRKQKAALAVVGRGFEEVAAQLAVAQGEAGLRRVRAGAA